MVVRRVLQEPVGPRHGRVGARAHEVDRRREQEPARSRFGARPARDEAVHRPPSAWADPTTCVTVGVCARVGRAPGRERVRFARVVGLDVRSAFAWTRRFDG